MIECASLRLSVFMRSRIDAIAEDRLSGVWMSSILMVIDGEMQSINYLMLNRVFVLKVFYG